jgi:Spy/CpxP family protein refolding chaperone
VAVAWRVPFVEVGKGSDAAAAAAGVAVALESAVAAAAAVNSAAAVGAVEEPAEAGWRRKERYKFPELSEQRQLGGSHEEHLG